MRAKISRESRDNFNRLFNELSNRSFQDINKKDEKGETILHHAAHISGTKTVRLLVEKGADINATNNKGETPLHQAAFFQCVENVKVLIAMGADVNATTNNKYTPLHFASMRHAESIVKELVKAGAETNPLSSFGSTPMYYARNNEKIVKLFKENGGKSINKLDEASDKIKSMYQGGVNAMNRITRRELKKKIMNLDEIKKLDRSLIRKDIIDLCQEGVDLIEELTALKKKDDEEEK